jgi:lipopolysaccharide/colanic/teichoic acid biosynthesis glycosyltransferase
MVMKRVFDIVMAVALIAVCLPLFAVIAVAMKLSTPGPILYGGVRVGLRGKRFRMWKFRSMVVGADLLGGSSTSADDSRLTHFGRFLRLFKLDEIPQLGNVLFGQMSLVGPRPQVPWAVERYSEEEKVLLTVRPGITDPASLRFSNEEEILRGHPNPDKAYYELIHPEKMRLSIEYVKNRTFWGDLRILCATLAAPFRRLGRPSSEMLGQNISNR